MNNTSTSLGPDNDLARQALERAKAIAAKLSGTVQTSVAPLESGATGKRKRWDAPPAETVQKRAWVSPTDEKPASHYVAYLNPKLDDLREAHADLTIRLEGRGATNEPPVPGVPQQPLHVVLEGPSTLVKDLIYKVENLVQDAAEADLIVISESQVLATIAPPPAATPSGSSYRPASVAQMIHGNNSLHSNLDENDPNLVRETLGVPHSVVGFIIGRGGETIAHLQASTGVQVTIQKESDLQPGQLLRSIDLVSNDAEALQRCRAQIESMVQERTRGTAGGPGIGFKKKDAKVQDAVALGHVHVTVEVPEEDVGLVIGKQGSTIRMIQEETGASVQVPRRDDDDTFRMIHITHPNEQGANAAKARIVELLETNETNKARANTNGHTNNQQAAQTTIQISIPDKDVGLCIGRQGCVIKHMQSVTNTRIQIPGQATAGETHRIATVSGSEEGCNQVRNLIQTIINDQSSSNIMSGIPGQQHHQQQHFQQGGGYYGQQMQQQPNAGQQGYSTEWAAYYAAQQVAGQQQQQQRVDTQPALAATPAPEAAQTAADTYHEQFFRYAYYYGEDAARAYYGAWSPPVGTLNPYGVNPNGVQAAPSTTPQATPSAATVTVVAPAPKAAASVVVNSHDNLIVRDSGKRKVSNLPAWMTKS